MRTMTTMVAAVWAGAAAATIALAAPVHADDAPVNLQLTDDVRAELVRAGAMLTGRPASEIGGLREGETYHALMPRTGIQWAAASLYAKPGQYEAGVQLQDQNSYMFFSKVGDAGIDMGSDRGRLWTHSRRRRALPVPESVRDLWQWPQGKCYPPPN